MATSSEDIARLGRRIATAQGYDASDASVNWVAYGREAELRLGRRQGVPDPISFRSGPLLHVVPARAPSARHGVRIGAFEVSRNEAEPARNRPQRHNRPGERTTGRYRMARSSPGGLTIMRDRRRDNRLAGRR
jgi:hypothetical protein